MFRLLQNWFISSLVILILAHFLPGVTVANFGVALEVSIILGLVNILVRPVLLLLALPITVLTLGLFVFVINALLVMLVASMISGFEVSGFLSALLFSLVLYFVNDFLKRFEKSNRSSIIRERARIRD